MAAGLDGDLLRRCYVQYGSTLRNTDQIEKSLDVFRTSRRKFPDSASLAVFYALTEHANGQANSAISTLLEVIADHVHNEDINRYKPAIRGNAAYIKSLD